MIPPIDNAPTNAPAQSWISARQRGVRVARWVKAIGLSRWLAYGLGFAAMLSVVATYAAITGIAPFGPDPTTVLWLLYINLILVLALGVLVARRLVEVWAERRRGLAGSRLHVRLVLLFGMVAVTPTIIVAVFSALYLNVGIQGWFSDPVSTAVRNSRAVADAYQAEHQQNIRADILAMAADLSRDAMLLGGMSGLLGQAIERQATSRGLSEAIVFDGAGQVLARAGLTLRMQFDQISPTAMQRARSGEVALLDSQSGDRVRAIVRLDRFIDSYLYIGRLVDPRVLGYVEATRRGAEFYDSLEGQRSGLQITFAMVFVVVALLLLLAAIWVGLNLATKLAQPVAALISAADRVRAGDLSARVVPAQTGDEIEALSRAFNRMTLQLENQQAALIAANDQLDQRRRFTETVLAGVSAGVIGLDPEGMVNLPNRSAATLLGVESERLAGSLLIEVVPDMAALIELARRRPDRLAEGQIKVIRERRPRTLIVRVAAERDNEEIVGFVVTFDDVTELLVAQRTAAWADVARRIAHEIKNPLTPIQLSAERLKRKYLKEITTDPEVFIQCTNTIVRQVGDIGRMVDEFSSFARMPAPVLRDEDLIALVRDVVFLQRQGNPTVRFEIEMPDQSPRLRCDARQVRQMLINLLQNAVDAIDGRREAGGQPFEGIVTVRIRSDFSAVIIEVEDNGKGLPAEGRDRLTEPYVTTRTKGTGLGLAIVRKIMEDHSGDLRLEDAGSSGNEEGAGVVGSGARIVLRFPIDPTPVIQDPAGEAKRAVNDGA